MRKRNIIKNIFILQKDNKNIIDPFKYMAKEYVREYKQKCAKISELCQETNDQKEQ